MMTRPGCSGLSCSVRAVLGAWLAVGAGLGCGSDLEGEVCDVTEELHECGARGRYNVCDTIDGDLQWGECHKIECTPGDSKTCDAGMAFCVVDEGVPAWTSCITDPITPLVLSFDRAEPLLEEVATAAMFDMGVGDACVETDWPVAETPWLALDRDRSGTIDGGHELFGSGTQLIGGGRGAHGFAALAELDSNADGRISAEDAQYEQLVLWADHDRDRRSTHAEHESLAARGVVIELAWRSRAECDARGNCGVERAAFTFVGAGGRVHTGEVIDLHLPCQ